MTTDFEILADGDARFAVVTYFTPDFAMFVDGLREDCERLSYPLHAHACPTNFENVIEAFDYKIGLIQDAIQSFGQILWLDVECRIDKPVPNEWRSPLISCYSSGTSHGLSSGVLMLDSRQLPLVNLWNRYARKYPKYPDDFVLDFLASQLELPFKTIPFEFYDRQTTARIARGEWNNENTIIRHPSTNRWPCPLRYRKAFGGSRRDRRSRDETIARQRKSIYFRNFPGDFVIVEQVMNEGMESEFRYAGWIFDAREQTFAPELFWPQLASEFAARPHTFEESWKRFLEPPDSRSFREDAIRKMKLSRKDRRDFESMCFAPD